MHFAHSTAANSASVSTAVACHLVFLAVMASSVCALAQFATPDMSGLSYEVRSNIELACILDRSSGPVAYNNCVRKHLSELAADGQIPDLSGLPLRGSIKYRARVYLRPIEADQSHTITAFANICRSWQQMGRSPICLGFLTRFDQI